MMSTPEKASRRRAKSASSSSQSSVSSGLSPPPTSSISASASQCTTPTKRTYNPIQFTSSPSKFSRSEAVLIGYVHSISNQRRNRTNTLEYSSFTLQTSANDLAHGLLYSKHKRPLLLESASNHTPVKLRNITYTQDGKVIVNDITNISTPQLMEYNFQFEPSLKEQEPEATTILELLNTKKEWDVVCLRGKIISLNEQRQVGSPRKRYNIAEAVVADETGSIPLDIWEDNINHITQGELFKASNVYSFSFRE